MEEERESWANLKICHVRQVTYKALEKIREREDGPQNDFAYSSWTPAVPQTSHRLPLVMSHFGHAHITRGSRVANHLHLGDCESLRDSRSGLRLEHEMID